MRFAVTGGAGFVGNNIVRLLVSKGHEVIVIDNLHTGKKENLEDILEKIQFYEIDVRNFEELKGVLKDVDGIFHEAALTIVQESFDKKDEYFDVNVQGTENILKIAKEYDIKVIFASSSAVYGDSEKIPIVEESKKEPINPYGETKLQNEISAEEYAKKGTKVIGLRYFNIFGKGQTGSYAGVITKFLEKIFLNEELEVFGDGKQTRDFIHVHDVAEINLIAMQSDIDFGFFNIGAGTATSINDLAKTMIELSNKKLKINYKKPLKGDIKQSVAYTQNTEKIFEWKSKISLKKGLEKLLDEKIVLKE